MVVVVDGGELLRSSRLSPGGTRIVNKRPIKRKALDLNNRGCKRMRNVEDVVADTPRALDLTNTDETATNRANERFQNANNDKQHRKGEGGKTSSEFEDKLGAR
jgi:hypothetical protein